MVAMRQTTATTMTMTGAATMMMTVAKRYRPIAHHASFPLQPGAILLISISHVPLSCTDGSVHAFAPCPSSCRVHMICGQGVINRAGPGSPHRCMCLRICGCSKAPPVLAAADQCDVSPATLPRRHVLLAAAQVTEANILLTMEFTGLPRAQCVELLLLHGNDPQVPPRPASPAAHPPPAAPLQLQCHERRQWTAGAAWPSAIAQLSHQVIAGSHQSAAVAMSDSAASLQHAQAIPRRINPRPHGSAECVSRCQANVGDTHTHQLSAYCLA